MEYTVHVEWTMCSTMRLDAKSPEDAEVLACETVLPTGSYLDESFVVRKVEDNHGKTVIGDN